MKQSKAENLLGHIQAAIGGELRISHRGVPHLLLPGKDGFSICYFGNHKMFRCWTGCGTLMNKRYRDFKEYTDVIRHFRDELGFTA